MEDVDHALWQEFLDRYLVTTDDERTLLRYGAVVADDRDLLKRYLHSLSQIDPQSLNQHARHAYWINLYNALTVDVVLDHPDKDSIRQMGRGWLSNGPWSDELIRVGGQALTLDDIEHRILRPEMRDRRVHFAVNCASFSCPNLAPEAYTAANLDRLLEVGEAAYLEHPRGLTFRSDGTLQLSSIFDWYRKDFARDRADLLGYLAGVRTDLADRLLSYQGKIHYVYDWSLNRAD